MTQSINSIRLVQEFHEVFNHTVASAPTLPDQATVSFRVNFMIEELKELQTAVEEGDLVGLADALGDIQYVLDGFFLNCGLHPYKDAILEAIHRSNMTKACTSVEHAEQTIASLRDVGTEAYYEQVGDYYIVKRTGDGKVMKALGFALPNLVGVLSTGVIEQQIEG
ncbi:pyrophosphohydrolase domain-containing protein [Telluribacter humicola]|uniref:nucleoside triphosphate pyrophosphohydrolase family protein n=1 Tax=Telluribacter humicola TaxID=1720261 RepID=UPI001A96C33C|nr:nucleoside triphosphate pyrophosphohydrolase family protein [Telluribacter humicola]